MHERSSGRPITVQGLGRPCARLACLEKIYGDAGQLRSPDRRCVVGLVRTDYPMCAWGPGIIAGIETLPPSLRSWRAPLILLLLLPPGRSPPLSLSACAY